MLGEALSFSVARARRGPARPGPGPGRLRPGRVVAFSTPGDARRELASETTRALPLQAVALLPAEEVSLLAGLYRDAVPCGPATEPALAATLHGLLAMPGDLVHAQLASGVGTALGLRPVVARSLGLAVELFHGAAQTLAGGESTSPGAAAPTGARVTLAALAMVHQGHAALAVALRDVAACRRAAASTLAGTCLGVDGVLGGQARALDVGPLAVREPAAAADALAVAAGRSVPLLRLALELPAMVAGAALGTLESLCGLARAWGLAGEVEAQLATTERQRLGRLDAPPRGPARVGTELVDALGWSATLAMLDSLLDESWELVRELTGSVRTPALAELQMALVIGRTRLANRLGGGR